MRLPFLNASNDDRQVIESFGGYNHQLRIGDGEFYDVSNISSDYAPVLAPRQPRGMYSHVSTAGMISKDSLCYVDGSDFVMNGYRYEMGLSTAAKDCPKQLVSMGAYVIIWPDGKYINTADTNDRGSIDAEYTTAANTVLEICKLDGTTFTPDYVQPTQPDSPENMAYWIDTSTEKHSLKQYSRPMDMWTSVATTYVRLSCANIGKAFKQYDGVKITGLKDQEGLDPSVTQQLNDMEGSAIVYAQGDDYIVIVGLLDATTSIDTPITVSRKAPLMDYIIENDNRLWGCRYGLNADGAVVNEIYACKLGDFKNWFCYMGISTDSYAVSLGSDGPFTGAITHQGHPCFFKENILHKIYGQIPANYQVQNTNCRGVQKGSHRSLAIVNEILYYKSQHAICSYDGSLPQEMSAALGDVQYNAATAAAHANKYYVCMEEASTGERVIFVYDTAKGLWAKESYTGHGDVQFCSCRDELYMSNEDGIYSMTGKDNPGEIVESMVETGIINAVLPNRAYLKKIDIRMVLEHGSTMDISAQYDSVGSWEDLGHLTGSDLRSFNIPVRPRRCDHLRLRLEATGPFKIYSMTKVMSYGSDKT